MIILVIFIMITLAIGSFLIYKKIITKNQISPTTPITIKVEDDFSKVNNNETLIYEKSLSKNLYNLLSCDIPDNPIGLKKPQFIFSNSSYGHFLVNVIGIDDFTNSKKYFWSIENKNKMKTVGADEITFSKGNNMFYIIATKMK